MKTFDEVTELQKVILSAYLGILLCNPDDLLAYLNIVFERRVDPGEFTNPNFFNLVRKKVKKDFEAILINGGNN